jgi:hypothetical protein
VDVAYGHAWAGLLEAPLVRGNKPLDLPGLPVGLPCDLPTFLTNPDNHAYLDLLVNQFAVAAMAGCGGAGVGPARGGGEAGGGERAGPTDRGWRRGSLYRGDGEGFLVHGGKREAY